MEVYSSNTSGVIRYDFLKYTRRDPAGDRPVKKERSEFEEEMRRSLEETRADMAKDDGMGSYGSYKCPIF